MRSHVDVNLSFIASKNASVEKCINCVLCSNTDLILFIWAGKINGMLSDFTLSDPYFFISYVDVHSSEKCYIDSYLRVVLNGSTVTNRLYMFSL